MDDTYLDFHAERLAAKYPVTFYDARRLIQQHGLAWAMGICRQDVATYQRKRRKNWIEARVLIPFGTQLLKGKRWLARERKEDRDE